MSDRIDITSRIAELSTSALPRPVTAAERKTVVRAFVDTMACAYAAVDEATMHRLAAFDKQSPSTGGVGTVLGGSTSAVRAALMNGTAAHVLDLDDTSDGQKGHPSAVLVPAILAAAETSHSTGDELIEAYLVGFRVIMAISAGVSIKPHYQHGWHSTSTIGVLGATAAVGRLVGLDTAAMASALAIASSMAGGSVENFGTMTKPLHSGLAASNAVLATEFAAAGITGSSREIEGRFGYLRRYGFGDHHPQVLDVLTEDSPLQRIGLNIKLYPCCSSVHPTIDMLARLRDEIAVDAIASIDATLQPYGLQPLMYHEPTIGSEAKFSLEFAAAAALRSGAVGPELFVETYVNDPEIRRLMAMVRVHESPVPPVGPPEWQWTYTALQVHLTDGSTVETRQDVPYGHASMPLDDASFDRKVEQCLAASGANDAVRTYIDELRHIDCAPVPAMPRS